MKSEKYGTTSEQARYQRNWRKGTRVECCAGCAFSRARPSGASLDCRDMGCVTRKGGVCDEYAPRQEERNHD